MAFTEFIGKQYPPYAVEVEKGRVKFFAQAIGSIDPIHSDEQSATEAGYPALPAPPTFAFSILMDAGVMFRITDDMGIPATRTVHGSQGFEFKSPIFAGDVITGQQTITDVYEKKGGALVFIEVENRLRNQADKEVCLLKSTIVVRNG